MAVSNSVRDFVVNSLKQFYGNISDGLIPDGYSYVYNSYAYVLNAIYDNEYVMTYALIQLNERIDGIDLVDLSSYALKSDLNSYVKKTELSNQSYVTTTVLSNQGYLTSHQNLSTYVSKTELSNQGYLTSHQDLSTYVSKTELSNQGYLTSHQDLSTYVSKTELNNQSYVTTTMLSSQGYLTQHQNLDDYVTQISLSNNGYITSTDLVTIYDYANKTYVANYVNDNIKEPEIVWETNGAGLTALETDMSANPAWQLTNLDMTPYKHIKIYTKAAQKSGTTASASTTAAMVLEMSLDPRAAGPYGGHYIGSTISQKPNDNNRLATLTCAVSADKTSFAVMRMTSLYGTAATSNSDVNAYVFKIVGFYDDIGGVIQGGGSGGSGGIANISFNGSLATITGSTAIINAPINDPRVSVQIDNETYSFTLNQASSYTINLGTVLRQHQSLADYVTKTELNNAGYITSGLPSVTSSDNGKILMVVNGAWQLVSPATIYSGNATPSNANGNNGDIYLQS